jgi:hypothetical protein
MDEDKFFLSSAAAIIALAVLLFTSGCSIDPATQLALAERRVNITVYGVYCVNQACGLGYLKYERNPPTPSVEFHFEAPVEKPSTQAPFKEFGI